MPVTKSAKKRLKTDGLRHARNLRVKGALKALLKGLRRAIDLKKGEEARAILVKVSRALDRAASKGVIHKNTARRRKSRLAKKVNKLSTA
ncbi:30S ribosomal protein S20 [bacterium]|nr:30S ribosomal protein S20 [bacterium]